MGNHIEIAMDMLERGANVDRGFVEACYNGCVDIANLMLHHGATAIEEGFNAAVSGGHQQLASRLQFKLLQRYMFSDFEQLIHK